MRRSIRAFVAALLAAASTIAAGPSSDDRLDALVACVTALPTSGTWMADVENCFEASGYSMEAAASCTPYAFIVDQPGSTPEPAPGSFFWGGRIDCNGDIVSSRFDMKLSKAGIGVVAAYQGGPTSVQSYRSHLAVLQYPCRYTTGWGAYSMEAAIQAVVVVNDVPSVVNRTATDSEVFSETSRCSLSLP